MAPHQVNLEYWFRQIYDLAFGTGLPTGSFASFAASIWVYVTVIGYVVAAAALALVVYSTLQLFELRQREAAMYGPIRVAKDDGPQNPRWTHIQSLMGSDNTSDWRQAIIEADIMLGEMLTRQGYSGSSIGDQLKMIEPADMDTLNDAWAAHKVRNDIAHSGSSFDLSQLLAQRTISQYENVFREFSII